MEIKEIHVSPLFMRFSKNNPNRVENYFLYFLVIRIELFITCFMLMKKRVVTRKD